jgi:hypothetical protein
MIKRTLWRIILFTLAWMLLWSIGSRVKAELYYNTYQGTGAYPTFPGNGGTLTYPTPRSSGTVATINHHWGNGAVLDSGLAERVMVNYYGYITIPTAGTYTFYNASDDGFHMKIDGAVVINNWIEQGTYYYNSAGSKTFDSAGTYAIDVWYYENGGGAASMLFWNLNGSIQTVSAEYYTTVIPTPTSAATAAQLLDRSIMRGITGSGIYIQQAGDNLSLTVNQHGDNNLIAGTSTTAGSVADANIAGDWNTVTLSQGHIAGISSDNVMLFDLNGDHNTLTVEQGNSTVDTGGHRAKLDIDGSYNDIGVYQYNSGLLGAHFANVAVTGSDNSITAHQRDDGDKMLYVNITGSNSTLTVNQNDSGEHFLDVTLGSNQTLSVTQEGSGDHAATVNMSGHASGLTLNQNSVTDQNYYLYQNCTNQNGCGTTTVNQQ